MLQQGFGPKESPLHLVVPALACLGEYTAALKRGWSPDNPPYAPVGDATASPTPDTDDVRCSGTCDLAPASVEGAGGSGARGEHGLRGG